MYKIGTINTINNKFRLVNIERVEELNFSTINVELEREKGKFIYPIHFDYILDENIDAEKLIKKHLKELKL